MLRRSVLAAVGRTARAKSAFLYSLVRDWEFFLMAKSNDVTGAGMAAVLIPVVVGSLLGLIVSVSTNFFTFQAEQHETLRKERAAHLERAMTLTARYANHVGRAVSIGIITKGDVTPKDLAILTAPTDTLQELNVVISLYFPELKSEVDQIYAAHNAMMQRFDEIIDARHQRQGEDAANFSQRIKQETAQTMEYVRRLMNKLSDPAMQKRS
jgi:hypothetical protein